MNASRLDSALRPATPVPSPGDLQVQVTGTIGGVLTDLVEIAERLPVQAGRAEVTARILDQLAGEIVEAASLLRQLRERGH